jgi:hypothetical protein
MQLLKLQKEKQKLVLHLKELDQLIWIKLGETEFVLAILNFQDFKERYRALADKHEAMIAFYDVDIQYNLPELEKEFFEAIEELQKLTFIDSEEYLFTSSKSKEINFMRRCTRFVIRCRFWNLSICNIFKYYCCWCLYWIRNCSK